MYRRSQCGRWGLYSKTSIHIYIGANCLGWIFHFFGSTEFCPRNQSAGYSVQQSTVLLLKPAADRNLLAPQTTDLTAGQQYSLVQWPFQIQRFQTAKLTFTMKRNYLQIENTVTVNRALPVLNGYFHAICLDINVNHLGKQQFGNMKFGMALLRFWATVLCRSCKTKFCTKVILDGVMGCGFCP